jgi:hypothetical protein
MNTAWRPLATLALIALTSRAAGAQTNLQLWGNLTFDWVRANRVTYSLDFEPKATAVVPEGQPAWRNLDVSPSAEYALRQWLDLNGEVTVGWTKQTDDVTSFEFTPRIALRFHFFSRDLPVIVPDRPLRDLPPKRRVVLRDLARVEWRNFFYSGDTPSSSNWRFRNRLEFMFPLNRDRISAPGAQYVLADWEWFIPLNGDPSERFANKQRIRAGIAYRKDARWVMEMVYMWTRSRDTTGEPFSTSDNILDVRVRRIF